MRCITNRSSAQQLLPTMVPRVTAALQLGEVREFSYRKSTVRSRIWLCSTSQGHSRIYGIHQLQTALRKQTTGLLRPRWVNVPTTLQSRGYLESPATFRLRWIVPHLPRLCRHLDLTRLAVFP